jgi:hypothetical protein
MLSESSEKMMSDTIETLERIRALLPLLRKITISQVLDSGDEVISAAGLNPWCVKEGRATSDERAISDWRYTEMRDFLDNEIAERQDLARRRAPFQKLIDELNQDG